MTIHDRALDAIADDDDGWLVYRDFGTEVTRPANTRERDYCRQHLGREVTTVRVKVVPLTCYAFGARLHSFEVGSLERHYN